ncbi:trypsin-like serine protease [Streptomyces lavendulocolor]|uniref:trypsin-like serine protease n=1 Tax=Streptomyces lavendulocolor TaxID=67316 RepID=UPI003C2AB20B
MRTRRGLAAATAAVAVVLGAPAPTASAESDPPANADAAVVVEDGAYPYSDEVLAATGAQLINGDGNITHTSCSGPYQVMVWARNLQTHESRICFKARDTGFLSVNIPRAYRIETVDRDVRAGITIAGQTQTLDIPEDTSKGFGEAHPTDPKQAVLLELKVTGSSGPRGAGQPLDTAGLAFNAKLNTGANGTRACSGALVDPQWVLTAKSCFADKPAESDTVEAGEPKQKTTVTVGKSLLLTTGGHTTDIVQLVPHKDRDLVMARLAKPAAGITPVAVAEAAPAAGQQLTVAGFGRTRTEWVPAERHHAAFTTGTVAATGFDLAPKDPAGATVCKGDAGGPALRTEGGRHTLVGVITRSGQAGCLASTGTRTGAFGTRVDDVRDWVQQTRALAGGWKTEALVQGGTKLYQAIRLADGTWTGASDVEARAGSIGGVKASAVAGINSDTHVLAIGGDGKLHHTIRRPDGSWSAFGDVGSVAGALPDVTQVSAVSIGSDLHVIAVSNGKPHHAVRRGDGTWAPFGDVTAVTGAMNGVTSVATASAGNQLQVTVVSGGKAYHTMRTTAGHWSAWGNVAGAAGATGPIGSVAMAGTGNDAHLVVATDNGTRQYHAMRKGDGTWEGFAELHDVLGKVVAKSLGAGAVDGELQLALTTTDNRVLHTVRRADRTWASTVQAPVAGLPGSLGAVSLAGTL